MKNNIILVVATRNKGKTAEIRDLLQDFPITIKNLDDFGPIPEAAEDGNSFDENAYQKSSLTARVLGLPALADDSGICVEALDGAPGIYSARYAGANATDAANSAKLLEAMRGVQNRNAAFECVLSLAVPTGIALTYEARCEGLIMESPKGNNGFGYDPIFYYPPLKKTFAQLSMAEKSQVSHRGKALREFKAEIAQVLVWIEQQMPIQEKFQCKE